MVAKKRSHGAKGYDQIRTTSLPIAVVIFDVVRIITLGADFSLSICVSSAFTTCYKHSVIWSLRIKNWFLPRF